MASRAQNDRTATGLAGAIRRHPVATYFIIAYGFSWTWVLAMALPTGIPAEGDALAKVFGLAFVGMALGPVIGSLALTAFLDGWDGLRRLGSGMIKWRAAPKYYALALCVVPACTLAVLALFWATSPGIVPGVLGPTGGLPLLLMGLGAGLGAGLLEEIGWTGFATRTLLDKWNLLAIGIVVGVLHGAWHFLAGYWAEGLAYGLWFVPYFLLWWIVGITGLRILVVWLYQRTGSILVAALTHASYTGGLIILWPTTTTPGQNTLWTGLFSVLLLAVTWAITTYGDRRRPASVRLA